MKVIEILNFNRELLKRLQAAGIRLEDARYIDLYADYTRLLDQGEKVTVFLYASFLYFLKRIVFVKRHVWFFRIYLPIGYLPHPTLSEVLGS